MLAKNVHRNSHAFLVYSQIVEWQKLIDCCCCCCFSSISIISLSFIRSLNLILNFRHSNIWYHAARNFVNFTISAMTPTDEFHAKLLLYFLTSSIFQLEVNAIVSLHSDSFLSAFLCVSILWSSSYVYAHTVLFIVSHYSHWFRCFLCENKTFLLLFARTNRMPTTGRIIQFS